MRTRLGWTHGAFIAASLVLIFLSVRATGADFGETAQFFVRGSLGGPAAWTRTLKEFLPLLMLGTAVLVALRAGLFNIGADGQFTVGALGAAVVVLRLGGASGMLLGLAAGLAFGALWALPAGWIRAYRGGHEVISTIMLNNIARLLTLYLVKGPIKDPDQQGQTTATFPTSTSLPEIALPSGTLVTSGLVVGLLVLVGFWIWERRTVAGYELNLVGANPTAASVAGVSAKRVTLGAMLASGAVAGLAGAIFVLGHEHRFYANLSPGYGFDALGVAMLAVSGVPALVPAALAFAVISTGTASIQTLGVPRGLSGVILGLTLLGVAAVAGARKRTAHE